VVRAFELAVRQLGDPRLRAVIWQSLALSLVLQIAIGFVAWWALQHFVHYDIGWVNSLIQWLGGAAVVVVALLLFPASFGIVVSIFMERIADIVEDEHYPQLGRAHGISVWTGIWTGVVFLVAVIVLNLVMLPFYILAIFIAGLGAVLFYAINGWLTGIVIVFLGTIPVLNLIVPVLGTAAMVHVAQTLRAPPFRSPGAAR